VQHSKRTHLPLGKLYSSLTKRPYSKKGALWGTRPPPSPSRLHDLAPGPNFNRRSPFICFWDSQGNETKKKKLKRLTQCTTEQKAQERGVTNYTKPKSGCTWEAGQLHTTRKPCHVGGRSPGNPATWEAGQAHSPRKACHVGGRSLGNPATWEAGQAHTTRKPCHKRPNTTETLLE
jgi:hypothetical protein